MSYHNLVYLILLRMLELGLLDSMAHRSMVVTTILYCDRSAADIVSAGGT